MATSAVSEFEEPIKSVASWGGGAVLVSMAMRFLFRQFSKGKSEYVGDRVEEVAEHSKAQQIARLEREVMRLTEQRDRESVRADQAFRERNEAIERGAKAIAEVEMLRDRVEELKAEVENMRTLLNEMYERLSAPSS